MHSKGRDILDDIFISISSINGDQSADFKATAYPADAAITVYANAVWNAYSNKLEGIMTQKWLHFGIMQPTQAWTDIRRTGYPSLTYPEDEADNNGYKTIPQRVKYPSNEVANNPDNNKAGAAMLADGDTPYSVLFWAKKLQ